MTQEKKNYTLPIIMMIILFGMISFVTNLAAPIGIIWKERFSDSNTLAMMGNMMNFLAYLCMGIPAGILLQKIGYKKTALSAIVVGFAGVGIMVLSGLVNELYTSFAVYLLGAFVAGFSMCMLNTVVNPMLNTLGGGGNKGNQLIQIGGTFNSTVGTLTPIFIGALIGTVSKNTIITDVYPVLFTAMGVFALAFIVLSSVKIPEPHSAKAATSGKDKYSAWSFRHLILGAVAIFVYVGVEVGIPGTLNLFLSDPNGLAMPTAAAGTVAGTYWFLMLIGRFIGVVVGGKVSSKAMLSFAAVLGLIFVSIAIVLPASTKVFMPMFQSDISFAMMEVPASALFLVLIGLCTSVMWGGIFNLAVEGLGKYTAKASGIFMMMVCGGGFLPLLQGALADIFGFMNSYWLVFAGLAYLLYYAVIGSKNVNKDIPVD